MRRASRRFQWLEWSVALDPEGILKAGFEGSRCRKRFAASFSRCRLTCRSSGRRQLCQRARGGTGFGPARWHHFQWSLCGHAECMRPNSGTDSGASRCLIQGRAVATQRLSCAMRGILSHAACTHVHAHVGMMNMLVHSAARHRMERHPHVHVQIVGA